MTIALVDPRNHVPLIEKGGALCNPETKEQIAPIVGGIPRFVAPADDYAISFGWQWAHWSDTLSDARTTGTTKRDLVLRRTRFLEYGLEGKSILECGMGGGDDTEVLLQLPFTEVHAFDLSTSVERARQNLEDPRLVLSQASIYEIPYADESFDFVFCHRVLQHTPDPALALRCVGNKVKPGGVLFAHCYKKSWRYLLNYKYRYRWVTKRLPHRAIQWFVEACGPALHHVNRSMYRTNLAVLKGLAYALVPFEWIGEYGDLEEAQLLELEKLVTFDALTPQYDRPMTAKKFFGLIRSEGFRIDYSYESRISPVYCTAVKL